MFEEISTWYLKVEKWWFSHVWWRLVTETNWAKNWDLVEIEMIKWNEENPVYKIAKVIKETKQKASSIVYWTYLDGFVKSKDLGKNIKIRRKDAEWLKNWDIIIWEVVNDVFRLIEIANSKPYVWKYKKWIVEIKIKERKNWVDINKKRKVLLKKTEKKINDGDFLCVTLDEKWFAEFVSKVERIWRASIDAIKIAFESGLERIAFPDEVIKQAESIENWCTIEEIEKREDLRNLFTFTMDWPDAKDLDDAVSIEKLDNWNTRLYVHIADLSHYVKEWTPIDIEASSRWNSTYFVDHVVPMIIEKLSNDLCSLNPNTDKLTMTWEMEIDKETWKIIFKNSKVYESVINSDFRTTYKEAQDIFEGKIKSWDTLSFWWEVDEKLLKTIKIWFELSETLNKARKKDWELSLESPESKIDIDEDGNPIWFKQYEMYDSNDIIKTFMVAANITSDAIYWDWAFLHRVHEKPSLTKVEKLKSIFEFYDIDISWFEGKSEDFINLLEAIKDHPNKRYLEKLIIRTQKRAKVSAEREWHFGLWLATEITREDPEINSKKKYSWSTSPIRRYPDLVTHRIIKDKINWRYDEEKEKHYKEICEYAAIKSNMWEELSERVEEDVNHFHAVKYMQEKIWESFSWYISHIDNTWKIHIELENTINWELVLEEIPAISKKNEDLYIAKIDWIEYKPGSNIKVKVKEASEEKQIIYFEDMELDETAS